MYKNMSTSKAAWIIVFTVLMTIIAVVYHGYVTQKIWEWFVVVGFHIPMLSLKVAIGINLLVGILTYRSDLATKKQEKVEDALVALVGTALVTPTFWLVVGYIIHII